MVFSFFLKQENKRILHVYLEEQTPEQLAKKAFDKDLVQQWARDPNRF